MGFGSNFGSNWGGGTSKDEELPLGPLGELVSLSEALSISVPFNLIGAVAPQEIIVQAYFSHPVDFTYGPVNDPANYVIPGLTVYGVSSDPDPRVVRLITAPMEPIIYELTVTDARSFGGDPLINDFDVFGGYGLSPTFVASTQSSTKIVLVFTDPMLENAELTNTASYTVTDIHGAPIPVLSVTPGQSPVTRVVLEVGTPLEPFEWYPVTISLAIQTLQGVSMEPRSRMVRWTIRPFEWDVPIPWFTGEVEDGILGSPDGQIFFSPAYEQALANSVIEVDAASVCTTAYDEYETTHVDSTDVLTLWSTNKPTTVLGSFGLWTPSANQGRPRTDVTATYEEAMTAAADGPATATLYEYDPNQISYLNNSSYTLFDNIGQPFVTANIASGPLTPINTTVIPLQS